MTSHQARQILTLYRPGTADVDDPQIAGALARVQTDEGLRAWFSQHCAVQEVLRRKFQEIPLPAHLAQTIRAERKTLRPIFRRRPSIWIAAAAVLILFIGLSLLWKSRDVPDQFDHFRARMVKSVLREYVMDIETNNMVEVRQFLSRRGAPADYAVPDRLERLSLTGAGLLRWRNHPVSMVCFDRGDHEMLFLFVLERSAFSDPPPAQPQMSKVNKLMTASWSQGNRTYVLAGPDEPAFPKKYL